MPTNHSEQPAQALERARRLMAGGEDQAAQQAYIEVLRQNPAHQAALDELGTLAYAGGFRSAARTAYKQLVQHHPGDKKGHVNLANLFYEEGDADNAAAHYRAALRIDPQFAEAHQGMARILSAAGAEAAAAEHWRKGFEGHALITKPYRGSGTAVPLLVLVSARSGNVPSQLWITHRHFAVTAIYAEFYHPSTPLPPHALMVNLIGDADLCVQALQRAQEIVARSIAPVINPPARVRVTGRVENAHRLSLIPGVVAPAIEALSPAALLARTGLTYPLLLRRPGFHTGRHFVCVETQEGLAHAVEALAADELLAIQYLDARGKDGNARKYRVMFIDGELYPLHLAISADWKVHYFSAQMAQNPAHREEERRFLDDMPAVLGAKAMQALRDICTDMQLQYAGIDFALSPDGSVLLFEANATMVVFPPNPDPQWDYRRRAIGTVLEAATQMLLRHAGSLHPARERIPPLVV
jgi:tetratricopeptide (TPR) repeat protein